MLGGARAAERPAGSGPAVIIVAALVAVGLGWVPGPWTIAVLIGATVLELAESLFWVWLSGRRRAPAGTAALVGLRGRVVQPCRPVGLVRVRNELWRARCDQGAAAGEQVAVRGWRGLELVVEPEPAAQADG